MKPTGVGLLAALGFLAFKLMLYMANLQHQVLVKAPFIPLFAFVSIGIVYVILRYRQQTTAYNWMEAFKAGGKVALLAGLIASVGVWVYYRFIDTDFLELMNIDLYKKAELKLEGEQLENYYDTVKFFNTPRSRATFLLSGITALGLIASLMISGLVRAMLQKD